MVHKIITDIHLSAVQFDMFRLIEGTSGNSCLNLGRTVVSIALYYTATPRGSYIDKLMAPRQSDIIKTHTWNC